MKAQDREFSVISEKIPLRFGTEGAEAITVTSAQGHQSALIDDSRSQLLEEPDALFILGHGFQIVDQPRDHSLAAEYRLFLQRYFTVKLREARTASVTAGVVFHAIAIALVVLLLQVH